MTVHLKGNDASDLGARLHRLPHKYALLEFVAAVSLNVRSRDGELGQQDVVGEIRLEGIRTPARV